MPRLSRPDQTRTDQARSDQARSDRARSDPAGSETTPALEALHRQLQSAVDALESGEQWQAWLDFAGRLHRYSFRNLMLIFAQQPTASQIAGYSTWQSLGRRVRRGEKALRVLAPVTRRMPVLAADGTPQRGQDGQTLLRQQVVGFRPAPVFDVSQTDGPPLPEPTAPELMAGAAPDGLWNALAGEVAERGYRLRRGPVAQLGGANGRTLIREREVWVRDDVDDVQAVKTLAHELAHILLHVDDDGLVPDCRGVIEVEAESVAHLVLGVHHVDTGSYTFPYVAHWAYPLAAVEHVPMSQIVARTGARVMAAAHQILTATQHIVETPAPEPAVAVRVVEATRQTTELRDHAETAAALPGVDRPVLLGVVADSHAFYQTQVAGSWVPDYLTVRGLVGAESSHQLGYAPAGWTTLTDHLRRLGYTDDHIEAAGMASRARTGNLIDRMRDRLTIPLRDQTGNVVGFSGRINPAVTDTGAPKYLNTPTTALFIKRVVLYGLVEHRDVADVHRAVLCEGPLDAIAVDRLAVQHRPGIFGVAASGTAFTELHALQLLDATRRQPICLALDADPAGMKAAETIWTAITQASGRHVTLAELPDGHDPASLHATDPGHLAQLITDAQPAGRVVAERRIETAHLDGHVGREIAAFRDLFALADLMPPEEKVPYALLLADKLHIEPDLAATLVAEINPHLLTDRVIAHCTDLTQQLDDAAARHQTMINEPATAEPDQYAITSTR